MLAPAPDFPTVEYDDDAFGGYVAEFGEAGPGRRRAALRPVCTGSLPVCELEATGIPLTDDPSPP